MKNISNASLLALLDTIDACDESRDWVRKNGYDLYQAAEHITDSGWLDYFFRHIQVIVIEDKPSYAAYVRAMRTATDAWQAVYDDIEYRRWNALREYPATFKSDDFIAEYEVAEAKFWADARPALLALIKGGGA